MVEICLLDWVPRKVILDAREVDALPTVLRAFVRFAADQKGLAAADVAETLSAVDTFESQFREAMADDNQAGAGKALARQMLADGVDLDDPVELQRWIDDFNDRPIEERDDVLGPRPRLRRPSGDR